MCSTATGFAGDRMNRRSESTLGKAGKGVRSERRPRERAISGHGRCEMPDAQGPARSRGGQYATAIVVGRDPPVGESASRGIPLIARDG